MQVSLYGDKKTPAAIFQIPLGLGIYLPSGLTLNVPGVKPVRIVVESCLRRGCSAATALTPELIAGMQKEASGSVELTTLQKRKVKLPLSFKGFTAGFAALRKG